MRVNRIVTLFGSALLVVASASYQTATAAESFPKSCKGLKDKTTEVAGWCAATDRRKGNCLACHVMVSPRFPADMVGGGNTAPPLVAMKARFADKAKLRAQIYDATENNKNSLMPPFGRHGILNDKEIDNIVEFLYTL